MGAVSVHPHARGERSQGRAPADRDGRFIPTPVGNATRLIVALLSSTVHPHARGERTNPNPLIYNDISSTRISTNFLMKISSDF